MTKVWYITGTSRGFGRAWATAALERGDQVAATARDKSSLDDLVQRFEHAILPIELDVTNRTASFEAVQQAHQQFGRLDVVINNAGYGHFGFVEELGEAEARAQIETNVFGALWTTQAAIPLMREQGSGHILQVSSIGGVVAFPSLGIYHASKWALEGLTESLAQEVRPFGIRTTLIEPGGFATDWGGSSAVYSEPNPAYEQLRQAMAQQAAGNTSAPVANDSVPAILAAVDAAEPPSRLLLTSQALQIVIPQIENRIKVWHEWANTSASADPQV